MQALNTLKAGALVPLVPLVPLVLITLGLACTTAQAQHRPSHPRNAGPAWHGDISRFHEHDWQVWRGGHWSRGRHDGRVGWWWVVGGTWYLYPGPVYPYPNPYEPPMVMLPPPTQYWYFCTAANAYYPYVASCPGGWTQVTATPPALPASATPVVPSLPPSNPAQ